MFPQTQLGYESYFSNKGLLIYNTCLLFFPSTSFEDTDLCYKKTFPNVDKTTLW